MDKHANAKVLCTWLFSELTLLHPDVTAQSNMNMVLVNVNNVSNAYTQKIHVCNLRTFRQVYLTSFSWSQLSIWCPPVQDLLGTESKAVDFQAENWQVFAMLWWSYLLWLKRWKLNSFVAVLLICLTVNGVYCMPVNWDSRYVRIQLQSSRNVTNATLIFFTIQGCDTIQENFKTSVFLIWNQIVSDLLENTSRPCGILDNSTSTKAVIKQIWMESLVLLDRSTK